MATTETQTPRLVKPLRLWPGVVLAFVVVVLRFIAPLVTEDAVLIGIIGGVGGGILILLWWLFFSRAPWLERLGAVGLIVLAGLLTWLVVHPSIAGGMMGLMLPVILLPGTVGPALVLWAVATRHQTNRVRRLSMVATIFLASGVWALARTDGVKGGAGAQLTWRWVPTAEERLLAHAEPELTPVAPVASVAAGPPAAAPASPAGTAKPPAASPAGEKAVSPSASTEAAPPRAPGNSETAVPVKDPATASVAWAGFRGSERDGVIRGVRIETDWTSHPPVEIWRRPVGPGWSSFAVAGDLIYTQEQRGEDEIVSCYRLTTGEPVWRHRDQARFYESNGGPGPRATPTLHNGRVYTHGATGIVNALDAATGARVWSRNAETDTGAPRPGWGFAGSPLVMGGLVVVAASGRLVAYDIATGEPRWTRATGGGGYSSPHPATIAGVAQILLLNGGGVTSVSPSDGSVLWDNKGADGVGIVQPVVLENGDLLVAAGDMMGGTGIRRLTVTRQSDAWSVQELWTSRGLKPYYNHFVVHKGHVFGFDGTILSCIGLETGDRRWKGGRYGAGQMMLLPAQDMLLVLSEEGELVLVEATPEKHTEVARYKAIDGKTWNHPVLVGDTLLVRNGEEMAAFRLPIAGR